VGNQNIFIKLYFSQPRWALKNRIKKLKEEEKKKKQQQQLMRTENPVRS
jgi:hypothetical protein